MFYCCLGEEILFIVDLASLLDDHVISSQSNKTALLIFLVDDVSVGVCLVDD